MLQEWCILGVGKSVLFREVSSVQGCGCIGVQLLQLTSSSQMYPMASSEASFTASVLEVPDTLRSRPAMMSGHWPAGSSAATM